MIDGENIEDDAEWDEDHWNAWREAEAPRPAESAPAVADFEGGADEEPFEGDTSEDDTSGEAPPDAPDEQGAEDAPRGEPAPVTTAIAARAHYPEPPCTLTVGQGECVLSVAHRYRMPPERIWQAPENAALRSARRMNVLLPGDALFVPARVTDSVAVETTRRHRFVLASKATCVFTVRFLAEGVAREGVDYTFFIDGEERTGKTDREGQVTEEVRVDAATGELVLHATTGSERYRVNLGHLNPIDDVTGVQARLNHLGYACGAADGVLGPRTRRALLAFQLARKIPVTGEADAATRDELGRAHKS